MRTSPPTSSKSACTASAARPRAARPWRKPARSTFKRDADELVKKLNAALAGKKPRAGPRGQALPTRTGSIRKGIELWAKAALSSDFKAFITKGNIIDMAVGVIIGGAFGKIVSSLVADIITPLISLALGKTDFTESSGVLREAEDSEAIVIERRYVHPDRHRLPHHRALCIIVLRIAVKRRQQADALLRREKEAEKEAEEAAPPRAHARAGERQAMLQGNPRPAGGNQGTEK